MQVLDLKEQLRVLEEKLLQVEVRKSPAQLDQLLAEGFIEFGSSGNVYHKQQIIELLLQGAPGQLSLTNFEITPLTPEVVLARYRSIKSQQPGSLEVHALRSSIWQFIDGRWQMVFHQGTPTTAPKGDAA